MVIIRSEMDVLIYVFFLEMELHVGLHCGFDMFIHLAVNVPVLVLALEVF